MVNKELRSGLDENLIVFDEPAFDNSIIGISTSGQLIYDIDLMIEEFAKENECSLEDASEFIYYNTVRALNYLQSDRKPIIKESIEQNIFN